MIVILLRMIFLSSIAVVFLTPGAALLAKATGSNALDFLSNGSLFGQVAQAKKPEISINGLLNGKTQQMAASWLSHALGKPGRGHLLGLAIEQTVDAYLGLFCLRNLAKQRSVGQEIQCIRSGCFGQKGCAGRQENDGNAREKNHSKQNHYHDSE